MKRSKIWGLLLAILFLIPISVKAEIINLDNYEQKNLEETLSEENIEYEFTDYKETDDQVTIYMFRGHGCGFCYRFLTFLNSITAEYGEMFKLRSFEIYNDANNSSLLDKMGEITGQSTDGVPYIIIGDKVFKGYVADWDDTIIEAIKTQYGKKEKFDYFEEYNKKQKQTLNGGDSGLTMIVVIVADVITVVIVVVVQNKNKKDIMRYMNKLYKRSLKEKGNKGTKVNNDTIEEDSDTDIVENKNDTKEKK